MEYLTYIIRYARRVGPRPDDRLWRMPQGQCYNITVLIDSVGRLFVSDRYISFR